MRELEYFVATSIDGYIAREDGDYAPLAIEGDHLQALVDDFPETLPVQARAALGVDAPNRRFDAVIMGARTYTVPGDAASPYPHLRQYVASRSVDATPADVTVLSGDLLQHVRRLKSEEGLAIWLCGGGHVAGQLLSEIDRLYLKVTPVVLGSGRPLFEAERADVRFRLTGTRRFASGVVHLQYARNKV